MALSFYLFNHGRVSLATSLLSNLIELFGKYGRPKFTTEYGVTLVSDELAMVAFMSLILFFMRPYLLGLAALYLVEVGYFLPMLLPVR
jgi:hypothetical protein